MKELLKKRYVKIILVAIIILFVGLFVYFIFSNKYKEFSPDIKIISSYDEYLSYINKNANDDNIDKIDKLDNYDFNKYNYVALRVRIDTCTEEVKKIHSNEDDTTLNVYFDINRKCGLCAYSYITEYFEVNKNVSDVKAFYKYVSKEKCPSNTIDKPMIYIYPEDDMDLTVRLVNEDVLSYTYPKYDKKWNLHVSKDGNIYDYKTNRNYYALYWEGISNDNLEMKEGFVVKGSDTVSFLEEKLELLGLNEREINEFIVYWINKIEDNNYNYIYFKTTDEINNYMPLEFSKDPDTLIRVVVDIKPLKKEIKVKPQELKSVKRSGFTIVEWGASYHD